MHVPRWFALVLLALPACGGGSAVPRPVDAHVTIARKDYPEADRAMLERGRSLFVERCSGCHSLPPPASRHRETWPAVVSKMAARAKIDPDGERAVSAYLVGTAL